MNTGLAPRARRACAIPTQLSAAPKLASGNRAMVGLRDNAFTRQRGRLIMPNSAGAPRLAACGR
jgi:hypothetical protein